MRDFDKDTLTQTHCEGTSMVTPNNNQTNKKDLFVFCSFTIGISAIMVTLIVSYKGGGTLFSSS